MESRHEACKPMGGYDGAVHHRGISCRGASICQQTTSRAGSTLKTLKGRYLFSEPAMLVPPAFGITEPTPGNAAGFHIFNGDGTGTDIVTLRIGGVTIFSNNAVPITYTVHADCTGSYTVLNGGPSSRSLHRARWRLHRGHHDGSPGNQASDISRRVSRRIELKIFGEREAAGPHAPSHPVRDRRVGAARRRTRRRRRSSRARDRDTCWCLARRRPARLAIEPTTTAARPHGVDMALHRLGLGAGHQHAALQPSVCTAPAPPRSSHMAGMGRR